MKNILITGAAGFIGSNFIRYMLAQYQDQYSYFVYDKLTYASNLDNLSGLNRTLYFYSRRYL